ncbi:FixJ family two-component response regulator [Sphingomonas zeicaulis]|uniref:response regulator n=1 Tax=Sphingomonas zeicaulis TaxID=1632740 RepID=UPI003D2428D8
MPRPPSIAIVDDDEALRLSLSDLFDSIAYPVRCFADVGDCLAAVGEFAPDVIVTDFHMPGLSGFDLLHRLRAAGCGTPVILITAFATDAVRRSAAHAGFAAVLKKPFGADELIAQVDVATTR